jgi:hypothetical protein
MYATHIDDSEKHTRVKSGLNGVNCGGLFAETVVCVPHVREEAACDLRFVGERQFSKMRISFKN